MTWEEWRRLIASLSGAMDEYFVLQDALNEALTSADEIVSGYGGQVGLEQAFVDLSADRDMYPLPRAFSRLVYVLRRSQDGDWWAMSPGMPTQFSEAKNRPAVGGYWSPVGEDRIIVHPTPSESVVKGLRVWGYPKHTCSPQVQPEHTITCPPHSTDYVKWYAVNILASGERKKRATEQLQRAEMTFRKHVEIPHSGVPPNIIREAF